MTHPLPLAPGPAARPLRRRARRTARPRRECGPSVELVREGASLVDVRERAEWRSGHAPQAVHVPLADLENGARRLPRDRPVVVMCASGMRSRSGAKHLRSLGFDATSLSGGIGAWQRAGGAVRR
ncbi:rhodanese-like domain-containing protein [Georgenia sp. SUBG003]|uniref:rhodanese-like domain-containing protein n=1 Tax=Georgenia sp. SUBG003 TaxID=1497974 RepID=UPI003AB37FC3